MKNSSLIHFCPFCSPFTSLSISLSTHTICVHFIMFPYAVCLCECAKLSFYKLKFVMKLSFENVTPPVKELQHSKYAFTHSYTLPRTNYDISACKHFLRTQFRSIDSIYSISGRIQFWRRRREKKKVKVIERQIHPFLMNDSVQMFCIYFRKNISRIFNQNTWCMPSKENGRP